MLRLTLLLALLLTTEITSRAAEPAARVPQVHTVRGVIREIAANRRTTVIRHEAIPGYMPAMTMELNVREPAELKGLAVGDTITFRLSADGATHWIDRLRKVRSSTTDRAPAPGMDRSAANVVSELKPGDTPADFELIGEDGRTVRFSDFRGRALAFTFIFTRCPLPEFCPRMNHNFAKARELLLAQSHGPTNWQFLSISFDPDFDKPAVLARYARSYRGGDTNGWLFASASTNVLARLAPALNLMLSREGGSISHNLRTVVLDPQGRISRQLDGNLWTPEDLAAEVVRAARMKPYR